ncbi:hypothetical protein AAU57_05650 [Nonlabens sp. YIK11]|nr:hypothetical protein AAU57_05650 [Nonlabens sp. YIK11]
MTPLESARVALQQSKEPQDSIKAYQDLAWYSQTMFIDSSFYYNDRAQVIIDRIKDTLGGLTNIKEKAGYLYRSGQYDKAIQSYINARSQYQKLGDSLNVAKINSNLGAVYQTSSRPQEAMKQYIMALKFFESDPQFDPITASTLTNIGVLHNSMANRKQAMEYFKRAERIIDQGNDVIQKANLKMNMGGWYINEKQMDLAKEYLEEARELAIAGNNYTALAAVDQNLGLIATDEKKFEDALVYFTESLSIKQQLGDMNEAATSQVSLATIQTELGNYDAAITNLREAISIFEKNKNEERLLIAYPSLNVAYIYANEKDSAFVYLDKYTSLRQKMAEDDIAGITLELDKKYQTEKKDRELAEQKSAILQKELEAKQRNLYLILLGLGLFFAVIIGWLIIRQKTLKNNQLRQESKLKAAQAEIEKQNSLQEQRLSISRDLHDNIGSQLTFLISSMDSLRYAKQVAPETANDKLENLSQFTRKTIGELRDTIWAMNHDEISFQDLQERLTSHINTANQASATTQILLNIDPEINKAHSFDSVKGMHIFRLIQEAINNSIKYSGSDTIHIDFEKADLNGKNAFKVTIKDDGKGFDPDQVPSGNGMRYMKERAEAIEADFNLTSSPENGTSVIAVVPC